MAGFGSGSSSGSGGAIDLFTSVSVDTGVVAGGGSYNDVSIVDLPDEIEVISLGMVRKSGVGAAFQVKLYYGHPYTGTDLGLILGPVGSVNPAGTVTEKNGPQRYSSVTRFSFPYHTNLGRLWLRVVNNGTVGDDDSELTLTLKYRSLVAA